MSYSDVVCCWWAPFNPCITRSEGNHVTTAVVKLLIQENLWQCVCVCTCMCVCVCSCSMTICTVIDICMCVYVHVYCVSMIHNTCFVHCTAIGTICLWSLCLCKRTTMSCDTMRVWLHVVHTANLQWLYSCLIIRGIWVSLLWAQNYILKLQTTNRVITACEKGPPLSCRGAC